MRQNNGKKKTIITYIAFLVIVIMLFSACGGSRVDDAGSEAKQAQSKTNSQPSSETNNAHNQEKKNNTKKKVKKKTKNKANNKAENNTQVETNNKAENNTQIEAENGANDAAQNEPENGVYDNAQNEPAEKSVADEEKERTTMPYLGMNADEFSQIPVEEWDFMNDPDLPDLIRNFVIKYPETAIYAYNYKYYSNIPPSMDIEEDRVDKGFPLLMQWDPRWAYVMDGADYNGGNACGPTCLAMVYAGLSGDYSWSPARMSAWSMEHGYYIYNQGTGWSLMDEGAESFNLKATQIALSSDAFIENLDTGRPIICNVGPGDFTRVGHYILLTGLTVDGFVTIHDPNSPTRSKQLWDVSTIVSQTKGAWAYEYVSA